MRGTDGTKVNGSEGACDAVIVIFVVVLIRGTEKECAVSTVANNRAIKVKEAVRKERVGRCCNIIILIIVCIQTVV
jgi:hypothetical protein